MVKPREIKNCFAVTISTLTGVCTIVVETDHGKLSEALEQVLHICSDQCPKGDGGMRSDTFFDYSVLRIERIGRR